MKLTGCILDYGYVMCYMSAGLIHTFGLQKPAEFLDTRVVRLEP